MNDPPGTRRGSSQQLPLFSSSSTHASSSSSSYRPLPSTDSLYNTHPYSNDYDYEASHPNPHDNPTFTSSSSFEPNSLKGAFISATRLRGTRQKLLWITAGFCIIYVFHIIHSPTSDSHSWHPHLPPSSPQDLSQSPSNPELDFYDPPKPPSSPPPSTHTAHSPSPADEDLPDLTDYIQPRRKIPSSTNPWSDSPSFSRLEWISSSRFGSSQEGWGKGMKDPDLQEKYRPPPTRYLLKAFEYAVKAMKRDWKVGEMGKGADWDRATGRVKKVERKWLKWEGRQGWELPSLRVGDLGEGVGKGEKKVRRVQEEGVREETREEERRREKEREQRRDWVKRAFLHAWEGYKEFAWGHDELAPVSNLWSDNYNGWGATLVDNLDTLLLMDLSHEYNLARQHVSQIDFTYLVPSGSRFFSTTLPPLSSLDTTTDPSISYSELPDPVPLNGWTASRLQSSFSAQSPQTIPLFETTIRYLGGLLSAYDLSGGDPLMLERAKELGDWLLPSLNTDWGLAVPRYKIGFNPDGGPSGRAVLAEVGSLGMELIKLSMITKDETYFIAAQRAMDTLDTRFSKAGPVSSTGGKIRGRLGSLLPSHINPNQPNMVQGEYTFGGLADSYYEYLIKQAQLTSFAIPQYAKMYQESIESAYQYLIRPVESIPGRENDLTTIGTMNWGSFRLELQHLTCFAGGMLGLGAKLLDRPRDLETAKNFTEACAWVYESSTTGIGGEQTTFYDKNDASRFITVTDPEGNKVRQPRGVPAGVRTANRKQIGRPETIESVFYMWRITGDRYWQDRGWQMFTDWVEHSITESGFATVADVNSVPVRKDDSMESFVTAETLKYYYLLFSPRDFISLDDYAFNTEAHPFYIPKPSSSSSSPPKPLWTGPEAELEQSGFVQQMGEGTWVQKWSRVLQAAKLATKMREEENKSKGGWFGGFGKGVAKEKEKEKEKVREEEKAGPVKMRVPIRPSEDELEQARKASAEKDRAEGNGRGKGGEWLAQGGGGRGMGGGAPP